MLINGNHSLAKVRQSVASKLLILLFGPKQHNINASGSKLYMNIKKNIFRICQKDKIFSPQHYYPIKMHPLSENSLGVPPSFWFMGYIYKIGSRFP